MNARKQDSKPLNGRRRAAILLLTLGPDIASQVYLNLSDKEIEQITFEIANIQSVTNEQKAQVIEEFYHTAMAKQYISHGGVDTAKEILERALGPGRSLEILENLSGMIAGKPFEFLRHADVGQLINFVQNEHPQTIALILAHLTSEQSAEIMSSLPNDIQHEVALRIATMDQTSPEIVHEVERILEQKVSTMLNQQYNAVGGVETLSDLLNELDSSTSRKILDNVEDVNAELASEVKKRMFTFDDLMILDDRSLQRILGMIEPKILATALKGANDSIRSLIFSNLSQRSASMIQEDIDLMGPVRVQEVEECQQKIISTLRSMEESGEITVQRTSGNDEYIA